MVALSPFLSLPLALTLLSPHPSDTGSLGILDFGLRARGSGEHAELAVPEPDSATDCAPLRVCGPSAGPTAIPRI